MNVRTTLSLAVAFVALLLAYVIVSRPPATTPSTEPSPAAKPSAATRDLLPKPLGEVVKIAAQRKGGEQLVFEKRPSPDGGTQRVWVMTAPTEMRVASYEVDRIARDLTGLQYEVTYKPGEAGAVSAADAGLAPAEAVVTLTDDAEAKATFEIGRPASENETYVRLAGSDQIMAGKANLRSLLKAKALEYRDPQLWNFAPENATRVEITDRSDAAAPVDYIFAKDGARWMMESPATARATGKVDEMLRAISRLRVMQWQDDSREKLGALYGLEPAALTIRMTVEETVPAEAESGDTEDEEGKEGKVPEPLPQKKVSVYELHVSQRPPIGEDNKVYVRAGSESAVATVMKTTTDKFKPMMAEWRDMRLTTAETARATRIEIRSTGEPWALLQKDGRWMFESDGGAAEQHAVMELLAAVKGLTAVAFVEGQPESATGLDHPQADVRLTISGVEGVERLTVGGFADAATKSLVYVRRNDGPTVAKVRTSLVEKLLLPSVAYRDRTVFDVPADRLTDIVLSAANRYTGGRNVLTFTRADNRWSMTVPVTAPIREDRIDKLAQTLASLKGTSVVDEGGEASAFGLNAPSATVKLTYLPPVEYRVEAVKEPEAAATPGEGGTQPAGEEPKPALAKPVEVQPPAQTLDLLVAEHDGKFYAKRADRPAIVEVARDIYEQLFAEFRTAEVLDFDPTKVSKLLLRDGDQTLAFVRKEGVWKYEPAPELPIDGKKLDTILSKAKDLKTERYAAYQADDLAQYGLASPQNEIVITTDDGGVRRLQISAQTSEGLPDKGHYATVEGRGAIFLLTPELVKTVTASLGEIEKR